MRVLITGSAGLIGSWIADELTKQGHIILGVDNFSGGYIRNVKNHNFLFVELCNKNEIEKIVSDFLPTHVFNCAASAREIGSLFQPLKSTQDNFLATITLLNACIKYKSLKKFIQFSSMAIYGNQTPPFNENMRQEPEDIYGINKMAIEKSIQCLSEIHDFNYTIIRPRNVFGVRQAFDLYRNVFAIFMNRIMHGEKQIYIFGDGLQKRSFSYLPFSLPCYIKCLEDFTNSQIYNVGGINNITLNEAAQLTLEAMDVVGKVSIEHLPPRPKEVKYAYSTYEKSINELGYKEDKDLLTCLKEMANWCKSIGPQEWLGEPLELYNDKAPKMWKS